jgi:hypothetical protein
MSPSAYETCESNMTNQPYDQIRLRFSTETMTQLRKAASENKRSITQEAELRIEESFDQKKARSRAALKTILAMKSDGSSEAGFLDRAEHLDEEISELKQHVAELTAQMSFLRAALTRLLEQGRAGER